MSEPTQGAGDQKARQEVVLGAQVEGARRIWRVKYWIVTLQTWNCSRGQGMSVCYNRGARVWVGRVTLKMGKNQASVSGRLLIRREGTGVMVGWGPENGQTGAQVLSERSSGSREEHRESDWQEAQRKHLYTEMEEKMTRSGNERESNAAPTWLA